MQHRHDAPQDCAPGTYVISADQCRLINLTIKDIQNGYFFHLSSFIFTLMFCILFPVVLK